MMVLGMILAMIVAGCAEYGARTNMNYNNKNEYG